MKAYIFLILLAFSSCSKNDEVIIFEISVVNGNTGEAITEGSILLQGLRDAGQLDLMGGPTVYEGRINIGDTLNTITIENNKKFEFFNFIYYTQDGGGVVDTEIIGCTNYSPDGNVEPSTCIIGENMYKIQFRVNR